MENLLLGSKAEYFDPEFIHLDGRCNQRNLMSSNILESLTTGHSIADRHLSNVGSRNATVFPSDQPLETLHGERSYLLNMLQKEDTKATNLVEQIADLEGASNDISSGKKWRRQNKKQLGWLKRRLRETTIQERTILHRLEQVTRQIQEREQCFRVRGQWNHGSTLLKQLNAGFRGSNSHFPRGYCYGEGHIFPTQPLVNPPFGPVLPTVHTTSREPRSLHESTPHRAILPIHRRTISANASCSKTGSWIEPKVKRMSLPMPPSCWVWERVSGREDRKYIGYYVRP